MSDIQIDRIGRHKFKVLNGTFYDYNTTDELVTILEELRVAKTKCRFHWGNQYTGQDWRYEDNVLGHIGRQAMLGGATRPILMAYHNSTGGYLLPSSTIVKIIETERKQLIFIHSNYYNPGSASRYTKKEDVLYELQKPGRVTVMTRFGTPFPTKRKFALEFATLNDCELFVWPDGTKQLNPPLKI